jgi:hypothetical protein
MLAEYLPIIRSFFASRGKDLHSEVICAQIFLGVTPADPLRSLIFLLPLYSFLLGCDHYTVSEASRDLRYHGVVIAFRVGHASGVNNATGGVIDFDVIFLLCRCGEN